jgi:hypothetical protein
MGLARLSQSGWVAFASGSLSPTQSPGEVATKMRAAPCAIALPAYNLRHSQARQ